MAETKPSFEEFLASPQAAAVAAQSVNEFVRDKLWAIRWLGQHGYYRPLDLLGSDDDGSYAQARAAWEQAVQQVVDMRRQLRNIPKAGDLP